MLHTVKDSTITDAPLVARIDHDAHRIEVTTIDLSGVHTLGRFATAGDAWAAIDALDCP